jgi:hypothetical protein
MGILERRTVRPHGADRCSVEVILDGDQGKWFRWPGPLVQTLVSRSVKADYRRLKTVWKAGARLRHVAFSAVRRPWTVRGALIGPSHWNTVRRVRRWL